jgi:hypothetical protein
MTASSNETSTSDAFITAYCDQFMPCCTKAGLTANDSLCRAFVTAFAPGYAYDPAAGDACLNEVRAASSSPTFCEMNSLEVPSCSRVFSANGTSAPGTPCQKSEECAPQAAGKVTCASIYRNNAEIRKCQVQIQGKAGDGPCVGTVNGNVTMSSGGSATDVAPTGYLCNVADGLTCDFNSQKCTPLAAVGQPCNSSSSCVNTAYCDFSSPTPHSCVARKPAGSVCGTTSNECETGTYCDSVHKLCTTLTPDGGSCTASSACASSRCVNGVCAKGSASLSLLCGAGG